MRPGISIWACVRPSVLSVGQWTKNLLTVIGGTLWNLRGFPKTASGLGPQKRVTLNLPARWVLKGSWGTKRKSCGLPTLSLDSTRRFTYAPQSHWKKEPYRVPNYSGIEKMTHRVRPNITWIFIQINAQKDGRCNWGPRRSYQVLSCSHYSYLLNKVSQWNFCLRIYPLPR